MQVLKSTLSMLKEDSQIYEVRIFDGEKRLKRVISPKALTQRYWKKFELEKLRKSITFKKG